MFLLTEVVNKIVNFKNIERLIIYNMIIDYALINNRKYTKKRLITLTKDINQFIPYFIDEKVDKHKYNLLNSISNIIDTLGDLSDDCLKNAIKFINLQLSLLINYIPSKHIKTLKGHTIPLYIGIYSAILTKEDMFK